MLVVLCLDREVSASRRFQMYYFYRKCNWMHGICWLYRGCPPFGESVTRGFTVPHNHWNIKLHLHLDWKMCRIPSGSIMENVMVAYRVNMKWNTLLCDRWILNYVISENDWHILKYLLNWYPHLSTPIWISRFDVLTGDLLYLLESPSFHPSRQHSSWLICYSFDWDMYRSYMCYIICQHIWAFLVNDVHYSLLNYGNIW